VPRLILLNGPPASGKSTLARCFAADHPLTLVLDVDLVRGLLGGWLDQPQEAGLIARKLALGMAQTQLADGRDVVVPQYLGRLDFVLALEQVAVDAGAGFVELALLLDPEVVMGRFARRSAQPQSQTHRDAETLLERSGGVPALRGMCAALLEVVASRPLTRTVRPVDGDVAETYRLVREAIGQPDVRTA